MKPWLPPKRLINRQPLASLAAKTEKFSDVNCYRTRDPADQVWLARIIWLRCEAVTIDISFSNGCRKFEPSTGSKVEMLAIYFLGYKRR